MGFYIRYFEASLPNSPLKKYPAKKSNYMSNKMHFLVCTNVMHDLKKRRFRVAPKFIT